MKEQKAVSANELLGNLRVLDLTDDKGYLCGKILGDMGADVIKIERLGGDPGRRLGPFYHDIPQPEKSLFWLAYNINKRGITLDIETKDGQEIFKRLAKTADFVVESFPPGYMDRLGLGYSDLSQIKSNIIMVSITPFGQTGPYKDYKGEDIVVMAMGGVAYLTGEPDRPPLAISFPQAYLHASVDGAAGAMTAYYWRESTGEGQHVDISAQNSLMWILTYSIPTWEAYGGIMHRTGAFRMGFSQAGAQQRQIWPCKDGYVAFAILGGDVGYKTNKGLADWIKSEGVVDEFLEGVNWHEFDMATVTPEIEKRIEEVIGKFFSTRPVAELYKEAVKRNIMLCPVYTPRDVVQDEQLKARQFWVELEHPELGEKIKYPGAWVKASKTPLTIRRRAPLIGEHNEEIYIQELGFSKEELTRLKQAKII